MSFRKGAGYADLIVHLSTGNYLYVFIEDTYFFDQFAQQLEHMTKSRLRSKHIITVKSCIPDVYRKHSERETRSLCSDRKWRFCHRNLSINGGKTDFNLILDGKTCDENIFELPEFREVFENINIIYLSNFNIDKSEILYTLKNAIRLEIKNVNTKEKNGLTGLFFEIRRSVYTLFQTVC